MEPPRRLGLGVHPHPSSSFAHGTILSTAPASPAEEPSTQASTASLAAPTTAPMNSSNNPPQHTTMAHLSFGPATQQTVTTVTTTTTVSLPPLIMKPPKDLYERDPKHYPLAFSPTPQSIKRFCFDVNGRPTVFHESEDPTETLRKYQELQAKIYRNNGSVRQEEKQVGHHSPLKETLASQMDRRLQNVRGSKRTATPPSIAEAVELASLQGKAKKQRSSLHQSFSDLPEQPSLNERAAAQSLSGQCNPSPLTPDTEAVVSLPPIASSSRLGQGRGQASHRPAISRLQQIQDDDDNALVEDGSSLGDVPRLEPPFFREKQHHRVRTLEALVTPQDSNKSQNMTAAPLTAEQDMNLHLYDQPANYPNHSNIAISSHQDASLPSPSLSPITAAANLASRQNAFDRSFGEHAEESMSIMSGLDLDEESKTHDSSAFDSQSTKKSEKSSLARHSQDAASAPGPTVMDIPTMLDAFDSMPESMQTYVMYQLLRRCAKPTLQMVANVVNPALKCDPFNILPAELGLNITQFLDYQSMCRAAQVSRRWRKLVISDEKAWKDLFERDGFSLPEGEMDRAIREGWGWQHPGEDGFEDDISSPVPRKSGDALHDLSAVSGDESTSSTNAVVRKKKNGNPFKNIGKLRRRQAQSLPDKPSSANQKIGQLLELAKGANTYAHIASQAVPNPSFGVDNLRIMHLFKSLYQRHFLIRKAWMREDSQPQHLAFRAHHRHVVTCLLFDSDKILTGSDDTKINVYDTKTGALRTRLEGHEGGVWALQYDGDTLVSGSTDRSVRVWDIRSGRCLQVFQGHTSTVRCLVILKPVQVDTEPDGTPIMMPKEPLIITGSRDSTLRVWKLPKPGDRHIFQAGPPANDRDNPYYLRTLSGHHNSVRAIAAHGDTLVSGSYDCTVRVWKISTGDLFHRLQGHTQKVYSVVLDHARSRCISGSMDTLVKVWDLRTGSCLFNLEGHTSLVGLLDLSHDRLVSAAADSTLRIWDPESGACKANLSAHTGAITCFQHDGQKVISGSDRTLKMWNVRNGECVRDLLTDLSGVWQVRFDERRCVAAVQRKALTYIEVLDFGASRDGVPESQRGRRIVVDCRGREVEDVDVPHPEAEAAASPGNS